MKILIITSLAILVVLMALPVVALVGATNLGPFASAAVSLFTSPKLPSDAYDYGNCTYWAALRRIQIGMPVPNDWGNAITWASRAISDGYVVDHTPTFGALMQDPNAPGGLGHVAFVESVNPINGNWTISEMNRVGWDEIDERTLSKSQSLNYNFIH